MYGLVNKAIESMVTSQFGEPTWQEILEASGAPAGGFISMDKYDDSITYDLVAAASKVLETEASELLEAFGEYWTKYTAEEGFGDLLDMSGSSFEDFLDNLDNMHARVALIFPSLEPPSFHGEKLGDGQYELHYHSERPGLAPMVVGMIRGLAARFDVPVLIEQVEARTDGADHDVFRVREDSPKE